MENVINEGLHLQPYSSPSLIRVVEMKQGDEEIHSSSMFPSSIDRHPASVIIIRIIIRIFFFIITLKFCAQNLVGVQPGLASSGPNSFVLMRK